MSIKNPLVSEIRHWLGVSQEDLALFLGISRSYLTRMEANQRNGKADGIVELAKMFVSFRKLQTGERADFRSKETTAELTEAYHKAAKDMREQEKIHRAEIIIYQKQLAEMQVRAKTAEHTLIVLQETLAEMMEAGASQTKITWLKLNYEKALISFKTCWEPAQLLVSLKIETLTGKARALRRTRLQLLKTNDIFKKQLTKTRKQKEA